MIRREGFVNGFSVALGAATLAFFLLVGWRLLGAVAEIITPFVVGIILALLLNPVVAKVQARYTRGKRGRAVVIVFAAFLAVFIGLVAWLVPTVISQTSRLVRFFAPLSYRIEQRVPGAAPKVLEDSFGGTAYTVRNLSNGTRYTFRIVAVDADGREYRLRPVSAKPSARQVLNASDTASGASADNVEQEPEANRTRTTQRNSPTPTATPTPSSRASSATVSATPTPRPTVTAHAVAPLPRPSVLPTALVSPSPSPAEGTEESGSRDTAQVGTDDFGDDQTTNGGTEATPSPDATPVPILVPGPQYGASASPSATPTPAPTPSSTEDAADSSVPSDDNQEEATPSPTPTPTATPEASPTPAVHTFVGLINQVGQRAEREKNSDNGRSGGVIRLSDTTESVNVKPGTLVATPGNGQIRLNWRPPANVQSGFDRLRIQADTWLTEHRKIGPVTLPANLATLQAQYSDQVSVWVQGFVRNIASTIIGSISILITIVLIPLVTLYVLSDMERLRGRLLFFLPERARVEFVRVSSDVGEVFGNYLRGMATVSAAYGVTNFAVFLILGLLFQQGLAGYAILLGFIAGVLYPVPYIGPSATTLIAGTIAMATGHQLWQVGVIIGVALGINQLFDNIIVPRLVGKSVGLHPLLTLFALLLGGNLFGLWGMLFSVPAAASIQLIMFRLFPRLGAPTPIAYLMPDKRPREANEGDSASRDLLKTPEALTEDKPDESRVTPNQTDTTGNVPLGPVPTLNTDKDPKAAPPPANRD